MSGLLVPAGYGEAELVEKRSRFIGRVWPVTEEQEALRLLKETQKRHWDANHNVYAYILRGTARDLSALAPDTPADTLANARIRYSDDGEPQGTSGLPVLDVFRKGGIGDVLCVVTRYFGGILLGTGGLVRAYGQTASLALEAAGIQCLRHWRRMELVVDYGMLAQVRRVLPDFETIEEDAVFAADVTLRVRVPAEGREALVEALTELTLGALLAEDGEMVLG